MSYRQLQEQLHKLAKHNGFWPTITGPEHERLVLATKLALVHAEVSEALEELRKLDFKRAAFGEELADAVIRLLDLAEAADIDLMAEVQRKHAKNAGRPYRHGKAF